MGFPSQPSCPVSNLERYWIDKLPPQDVVFVGVEFLRVLLLMPRIAVSARPPVQLRVHQLDAGHLSAPMGALLVGERR